MLLFLLACSGSPEPPRPPDLVLVTWDTVRADHLNERLTPWAHARGQEGKVFTQARTTAPLTLPAHASMLTGLYPHEHGARANAGFPFRGFTLADELSAAGYATGAFVSSAVLDEVQGLASGFQVYDDEVGGASSRYYGERPGEQTVQAALAWAAQQDPQQPLFLWVHLFDAHAPLSLSPEQVAPWGTGYAAEVHQVDVATERLHSGLQARDRPAFWVLTSDHGESLGEHGEFTHGFYAYDSTLHVPLIIWGEGVTPGLVDEPVSVVDLAPTLRGAAGQPTQQSSGIDLAVVLSGLGVPPKRPLLFESVDPALSYGTRPLFGHLSRGETWIDHERYALASDPQQLQDLTSHEREAPRAWPPEQGELGGASLAQLQALGYVGGQDHGSDRSPHEAQRLMQLEQTGSAGHSPGQALAIVREIVAEQGHSAASLNLEVELLKALGRTEEALQLAGEHEELAGQRSSLSQELARARMLEEAIRASLEEQPDQAVAHADLAQVLWTLGRLDQARMHLERALELGDEASRGQLVTLLVVLEQPAQALALIEGRQDPDSRCRAGRLGLLLDQERPQDLAQCTLVGLSVGPRGMEILQGNP